MATPLSQQTIRTSAQRQIVAFSLGSETYGVDIGSVREIIPSQKIVPVPRAPEFVEGIINLRGRVIPVLDLRKHFGLLRDASTVEERIILVESGEDSIGVVVDAVSSVMQVPVDSIEAPAQVIVGPDIEYIEGIAKVDRGLIVLVDLTKIISDAEKKAINEAKKPIVV